MMNNNFLLKKSYEIGYALYRLADVARRRSVDFAARLESHATDLMSAFATKRFDDSIEHTDGLEYLLRLGADVGLLHHHNVQSLLGEVIAFREALVEEQKQSSAPQKVSFAHFSTWNESPVQWDIELANANLNAEAEGVISSATDFDSIANVGALNRKKELPEQPTNEPTKNTTDAISAFEAEQNHTQLRHSAVSAEALREGGSGATNPAPRGVRGRESRDFSTEVLRVMPKNAEKSGNVHEENAEIPRDYSENQESGNAETAALSEDQTERGGLTSINEELNERHEAILQRIAENGNCRTKEIKEVVPDVSNRTLRYDLQKLMEYGLVERRGSGGPATYYTLARSK